MNTHFIIKWQRKFFVNFGLGGYTTLASIAIIIDDINDNNPDFESSSTQIEVSINEDAKTGLDVATLQAFDPDEGYNGLVKYRLIHEMTSQNFAIDTITGENCLIFYFSTIQTLL